MTQNAQDVSANWQTRSYLYDGLGRITQEKNAEESSTTYYTYDTDSTCGTYNGDLVKKVDAVGNVTCFAYDALHRVTAKTYPSGSYASVTPEKHYVYDAATINGTAMTNAKGRLAEAYSGPSSAKITDEGFSYSARGEVTDTWEWTQHSSGWYHVTASYWANGVTQQVTIPGVPTITYGVDSEGRAQTVSASQGQNPVTATTYNVSSLPTAVTLGSSDSDSFSYDTNTNRPTKYMFNINGQSVVGNLTWNSNGSLQNLNITDPFNPANQQTCNYSADDLGRLSSVSCGSTWSQTFTYDVFGNISKSGSISWAASYNPNNNHVTTVGSFAPSYDANGNLTNDTAHSYNWNSEGSATTIDSVTLTYDAMGRMIEQNRSGAYTQILYGPDGSKLALFNGQALSKAFVGLPAGASAVFTTSGLNYYRHTDWLGSSRFASTSARAEYYDGAYAPFGESYSESGTADRSFTGDNQDTVSGLYDFAYRENSPTQGRWISPDPASTAVFDLGNPQSLNRYTYVLNNPLRFTDPFGLWLWEFGGCYFDTVEVEVNGEFQGYDTNFLGCFPSRQRGPDEGFDGGGGGGVGGGGHTGTKTGTPTNPNPKPPTIDCSQAPPQPPTPPTAKVQANMQQASQHGELYWLAHVAPLGPWDYKQQGAQYTSFGNFNFGATCNALGMSLEGCQRGAGLAAVGTSTIFAAPRGQNTAGPGNPLGYPSVDNGMPVYGDQPGGFENQSVIAGWGYAQWAKQCQQQSQPTQPH